jgi:hypothetical protein
VSRQNASAGVRNTGAVAEPGRPADPWPAAARGRWPLGGRPAVRQFVLIGCFLAAGIAATWPRAAYLTGRVPAVRDLSSYIWDLWWVAHQVAHPGNPWFTRQLAAPAGIQLGFDTTMPLAGAAMAPVTLTAGPAASFYLLTIVMPGLACYLMYRAARLWLRPAGAIAAGPLFGLSSMLAWQDWYHLNIAAGTLALPMTLEAAIRLRRRPGRRQGVILGAVLGASVLVNQESAVMALILAAAVLGPWLARRPARPAGPAPLARLAPLALGAVVALVIASPQLAAMAQQASAGGASVSPHLLAANYGRYGAQLPGLFGPSPRLAGFGLPGLPAADQYRQPAEGVPVFGLALTVLALAGLAASWRRRGAWLLAAGWLGCAALALGPTLYIGGRQYVPLAGAWDGARVSLALPYSWFIRIPGMSALREADRLALLGLVPAALLAGAAVDWIRGRLRPAGAARNGCPRPAEAVSAAGTRSRLRPAGVALLALTALALAAGEAGWSGQPGQVVMSTSQAALDRPIDADHSGSVVLDLPFGLRGGLPLYGKPISARALLLATADGHPRAISYTSWVPAPTAAAITAHAFYRRLIAAQRGQGSSPAQQSAARQDARRMDIGWVLAWQRPGPAVSRYLAATGFRFSYRADGVAVYQPR